MIFSLAYPSPLRITLVPPGLDPGTAVFNVENQQGDAGQLRDLCSILCNNLMVTRRGGWGRDSQGVWDGYGHTAVFNKENQQGPAVQHRGLCSMSRGSLDGGEFGGEWTHVYV